DYATCVVLNRRILGSIRIVKEAIPQDPQPFGFTGDLGSFSLVDDGSGASASRTFAVPPGTYTVTASVPAGWTLAGITCTSPGPTFAGTGVTIPLAGGQSIACTFRNPRGDQ